MVNIGRVELGALNVAAIREWYAAALHTAGIRAKEQREGRRRRRQRKT